MKKLSTIIVGTAFLAVAMSGCKKQEGEAKQEPTAAKPAEPAKPDKPATDKPKELTAADYAKSAQAGWAAFNSGDMKAFGDHFADDATLELVDSGQPVAEGKDAVLAVTGGFRSAFSDMKGEQALFLVSGNRVVTVDLMTGTNDGELMGMPATNKKAGLLIAHVFELNAEGKVQKESVFMDMGTLMGQLGAHKMPHRAVMEAAGKNADPIIAADDDKEKQNLELVAAADAQINERKMDEFFTNFSPDFVMSDQTMPADIEGLEKVKGLFAGWMKAFSDMKMEPVWSMAAGDYVVRVGKMAGTNDGPLPEMGIKKPTGKTVSGQMLEVISIADGKATKSLSFGNGMAFATQLGLIEPPKK